MRRAVIVFVGGGIGSCLRGLLLLWLAPWGTVVPLPVLLANMLGAFILGVVFVLADEAELLHVETRLFLAVGVLGGFTTFSTFIWGAGLLAVHSVGDAGAAIVYLFASVTGGVVAVGMGLVAGREVVLVLERRAEELLTRLRGGRPRRLGEAQADLATVEAEEREEAAEGAEESA